MAELGKKLGKLSLAILENFVEGVLGEKFVDELRAPTDSARAIETALENSEKRFRKEFTLDLVFAEKMFSQVNDEGLGQISDAIEKFYDHPTDPDFQNVLDQIISNSFPDVEEFTLVSAVELYVNILTEEFALADEKFRENVRALADLQSLAILRNVEALLSQRDTTKVENVVFRSLHQLPPPPADFTGREQLIAELLKDFESHKGATISGLTGMGGIGKTALGLAVAHQIAKEYPDAQISLDLKGTTTPLSVVDIARHVILSFEPSADLRALDESNMQASYQSVLHGKKVLLFFDNARSAEQIAKLTPPDTCAMLVTSRWNFTAAGLKTHKVGVMEEDEAINFLLELCPRTGNKAAELAKACGHLPLALRIAGSFLQENADWAAMEYVTKLNEQKLKVLKLDDNPELNVEAAINLSYEQLSKEEQHYWRTLALLPTLSKTEAAGIWTVELTVAHELLSKFRRCSLMQFNEILLWYTMHDLLREFAIKRLNPIEIQQAKLNYSKYLMEGGDISPFQETFRDFGGFVERVFSSFGFDLDKKRK